MAGVAFDKSKPMPAWLCRPLASLTPAQRRRVNWYRKIWRAQPDWQESAPLLSIYRECWRMRQRGKDVTVDHIVPMSSPRVCGLHVPWNLRIISRQENAAKSNYFWPGGPEHGDLLEGLEPEPHQLTLGV